MSYTLLSLFFFFFELNSAYMGGKAYGILFFFQYSPTVTYLFKCCISYFSCCCYETPNKRGLKRKSFGLIVVASVTLHGGEGMTVDSKAICSHLGQIRAPCWLSSDVLLDPLVFHLGLQHTGWCHSHQGRPSFLSNSFWEDAKGVSTT